MLSEGQNVGVVLQAGDEHIMLYKIDNVVVKLVKSMEHETGVWIVGMQASRILATAGSAVGKMAWEDRMSM